MPTFRPPPRALVNLLFAGALLRLIGLGIHPLWLDEGATWSWASRPTWGGTVLAEANHPPLWWVVTRLWIGAFGDTEAALRAPAAILGIVSIPLAWWLGRRLLDPALRPARGGFDHTPDDGRGARLALWFAGFVTLSTYFTEYAQDARMYAALIAEGLGLSLLYLRWLDKDDRASLIGYAVLAALALYTHYFAIWIVAGHGLHALWLWWRGRGAAEESAFRVRPFVLAAAGAGVLFLPWFAYLVTHYEGISTGEPYSPFARLFYVVWRVGVGPGLLVVDRLRLEEGIGSVLQDEWATAMWTSIVWFAPLVCGAWLVRKWRGVGAFVLANLAVPVILLLLVFPIFPLIHERYLVFLAPWLCLLATVGALEARGTARVLMLGGLFLLLGAGLVAFHGPGIQLVPVGRAQALGNALVPQGYGNDEQDPLRVLHHGHPYGKEPWRQAHTFIDHHAKEGDLVLLHPPYLHLVWDYYDRNKHERVLLPRETIGVAEMDDRFGNVLDDRRRVFLVLAHEETMDPDYYFRVLWGLLQFRWRSEGDEIQVVKPILFDCSWGVRVAVFNRR